MAKLNPIDQITRDYIAAVRSGWNGDLAFTPSVIEKLRAGQFSQLDVLEVVEDGDPVTLAKDSADETIIELASGTGSGAPLRVIVSFNPHLYGLCVVEVAAL